MAAFAYSSLLASTSELVNQSLPLAHQLTQFFTNQNLVINLAGDESCQTKCRHAHPACFNRDEKKTLLQLYMETYYRQRRAWSLLPW